MEVRGQSIRALRTHPEERHDREPSGFPEQPSHTTAVGQRTEPRCTAAHLLRCSRSGVRREAGLLGRVGSVQRHQLFRGPPGDPPFSLYNIEVDV